MVSIHFSTRKWCHKELRSSGRLSVKTGQPVENLGPLGFPGHFQSRQIDRIWRTDEHYRITLYVNSFFQEKSPGPERKCANCVRWILNISDGRAI